MAEQPGRELIEDSVLEEEEKVAYKYACFMVRWRWVILTLVIIGTVVAATQVPKVDIRNDPDTLLPPTNRYVATNTFGEHRFGMGNLMVLGIEVKEGKDVYQPWFINLIRDLHNQFVELPDSISKNFIDVAAQKVKFMGSDEDGLKFKRMIPTGGIDTEDPVKAQRELDFLKKAIETNPVLAPMLIYKERVTDDPAKRKCNFGDPDYEQCTAKAMFLIADYTDEVKQIYLPWVEKVIGIVKGVESDPRYAGKVHVLTAGEPYFLAYMLYDLKNKWWLFVISILIVVAVLWQQNKTWRGALFPLFGVFVTITWTLGAMGYTQFKLTTMMVLTPMLLLAIGTGHAVQITRRFLQEVHRHPDEKKAACVSIEHTMIPATLSIVTDAVGFATLSLVDISFYKAYAYFGMFGMFTLLLTTTTLIPLLMVMFAPKEHAKLGAEDEGFGAALGRGIAAFVTGPSKWVTIGVVGVIVGVSTYYTQIYKATPDNLMPGVERGIDYSRAAFKAYAPTIVDIVRLGELMPGVISVNIPITSKEPLRPECEDEDEEGNPLPKGCWDPDNDPEQGIFNRADTMAAIERFEDYLRGLPTIGFTGSYVQYLKIANMLLVKDPSAENDLRLFHIPTADFIAKNRADYIDPQDPEYEPATPENADSIVSSYNGLLDASASPGDMDSFVDITTWNDGIIMGFVNTMNPVKTHELIDQIKAYIRAHENDPGLRDIKIGFRNGDVVKMPGTGEVITVSGPTTDNLPGVGGFLGATEATREVANHEWLRSPLQTALAILIISALMFRSLVTALILISILLITLFAQYGLAGYFTSVQNWSGILHFANLVALSIAMGLGVDYSIYMMARLREEMIQTKMQWQESLRNTLSSTGTAVFVSVIVLLGSFIPLLNTQLANTWGLGIYIIEALIIDVFTALTLVPILVAWIRPRYVFCGKGCLEAQATQPA